MSSYEQARQLKKLSLKLQYLREENQDVQDDLSSGKWELNLAVLEAFSRAGKKIDTSNVDQQSRPASQDPDPSEVSPGDPICKKLFRKIAVIAHPDKLLDTAPEERDYLEDLYRQAAAAAKAGDRATLVEIATSLDIDVDVDPDLQISAMAERADTLEKGIDETRQSLPYVWAKSKEDIAKRESMLRAVVLHMGIEISDEIIRAVLQWISDGFPGGTSYGAAVEIPQRRAPPPRTAGTRPEKLPKRRK